MRYGSEENNVRQQLRAKAGRRLVMIGGLVGVLIIGTMVVSSFSRTIQPGNVGVLVRTLGPNAGVEETALRSGWRVTGLGESVIEFPTIQRTYTYTREPDERGAENEEVTFSDNTGLPMTADVQIVLRVGADCAPSLYTQRRLTFDQLFEGPIRNDVRTAIAAETELVNVEELYSGGRQGVIQRALARVQRQWAEQCVEISQLDWIGNIRYPDVILQAIQRKTEVDQETLAAQARVAQATARANERIEEARGFAESFRIRGEAIRANPQVLREAEIRAWRGWCPLDVDTCIVGGAALTGTLNREYQQNNE